MASRLFDISCRGVLIVISLLCLVSIRDLKTTKPRPFKDQEQTFFQDGADAHRQSKAVALAGGIESQQLQRSHRSFVESDDFLAMSKSPEVQFPCAQVRKLNPSRESNEVK